MSSATDKDIVTIEGLSTDGDHPVQWAWTACLANAFASSRLRIPS
jgi:aerobic-type carbon monoxide dehydrogenase small subunit (CoxS/CutS family)